MFFFSSSTSSSFSRLSHNLMSKQRMIFLPSRVPSSPSVFRTFKQSTTILATSSSCSSTSPTFSIRSGLITQRKSFFSTASNGDGGEENKKQEGGNPFLFFMYLAPIPIVAVVLVSAIKGWQERETWYSVEAQILPHSASLLLDEEQERNDGDPISSSYVTFRYQIGDRVLQKTQIRSPFWTKVNSLVGHPERIYQPGDIVEVRCKPQDPSFTVLDPLFFSWYFSTRSKYDKIADFVDGLPDPGPRGYELSKLKENATKKRRQTPFVGRTQPPPSSKKEK